MHPRSILRTSLAAAITAALALSAGACGGDGDSGLSDAARNGRTIANNNGCAACHGSDGQGGVGPAWVGLLGSEIELDDGTTVIADEEYIRRSIVEPDAQIHAGFQLRMPPNGLTDEQVDDVVTYILELGSDEGAADG